MGRQSVVVGVLLAYAGTEPWRIRGTLTVGVKSANRTRCTADSVVFLIVSVALCL